MHIHIFNNIIYHLFLVSLDVRILLTYYHVLAMNFKKISILFYGIVGAMLFCLLLPNIKGSVKNRQSLISNYNYF